MAIPPGRQRKHALSTEPNEMRDSRDQVPIAKCYASEQRMSMKITISRNHFGSLSLRSVAGHGKNAAGGRSAGLEGAIGRTRFGR